MKTLSVASVCVCVCVVLLNAQEGEQRHVGLLVEAQDALPVDVVLLLLLQRVEGEERRVEPRQQHGQQQRRAARHAAEETHGSIQRDATGSLPGEGGVAWSLPRLWGGERGVGRARLLRGRGLWDETALFWQVWEQKPDDLEDAVEVGLDLVDGLRQQPAVRSHAHVGHPVDRHQGLHQAAQRVERGVARLEGVEEDRVYEPRQNHISFTRTLYEGTFSS